MNIKKIALLAAIACFLILPNAAFAQLGYCSCPNITFSATSGLDADFCMGVIGGTISATCNWNASANQCQCQTTFSRRMEESECTPNPDEMLEREYGGTYLSMIAPLGTALSVTGNCSWRSAEAPGGPTTPGGETPGGPSIPERVELEPPFGQGDQEPVTYIQTTIGLVIQWALGIVGSIALLMFVLGGFFWLTSGGSPDRIQKGKSMIIWATIGLFVIFAAYAITRAIFVAILGA